MEVIIVTYLVVAFFKGILIGCLIVRHWNSKKRSTEKYLELEVLNEQFRLLCTENNIKHNL